jgi:hypothetical protein
LTIACNNIFKRRRRIAADDKPPPQLCEKWRESDADKMAFPFSLWEKVAGESRPDEGGQIEIE